MSLFQSLTKEEQITLFNEAKMTIVCTHNKNGTIHAIPIWFRYGDDEFFFITFKKSRKLANLKRDNTVSMSIMTEGSGDVKSKIALVYGKAEINVIPDEELESVSSWILDKYLSKKEAEQMLADFRHLGHFLIKVKPDKIIAYYP